jgi:hypothetical protein
LDSKKDHQPKFFKFLEETCIDLSSQQTDVYDFLKQIFYEDIFESLRDDMEESQPLQDLADLVSELWDNIINKKRDPSDLIEPEEQAKKMEHSIEYLVEQEPKMLMEIYVNDYIIGESSGLLDQT